MQQRKATTSTVPRKGLVLKKPSKAVRIRAPAPPALPAVLKLAKLAKRREADAHPSPPAEVEPTQDAVGLPTRSSLTKLKERWGKELIDAGWVALPSIILERQDALELDAFDINIILHLAKHWWDVANLPHPSKNSIAKAMRCEPRTIQKRLKALEAAKYVQRIERRTPTGSLTSKYDLSGLITAASAFAKEALEERARVRGIREARLKSRRPARREEGGDDNNK